MEVRWGDVGGDGEDQMGNSGRVEQVEVACGVRAATVSQANDLREMEMVQEVGDVAGLQGDGVERVAGFGVRLRRLRVLARVAAQGGHDDAEAAGNKRWE